MQPFLSGSASFAHGITFGGHPVASAVALANLDIFEREDLNGHVRQNTDLFRSYLNKLNDLPIVGDVRGDGYFFGIELVKDKATKETFDEAESDRLLRGFLSQALFEAGLYCRADDRGDPVVQLAPAAELRRDALRGDRADPAQRSDRGMDPALSRRPSFWLSQLEPFGRPARSVARRPGGRRRDRRRGLHRVVDGVLPRPSSIPTLRIAVLESAILRLRRVRA